MSSLTLSLIAEAYPPKARTGPIGLWAAVSGLAVAAGRCEEMRVRSRRTRVLPFVRVTWAGAV